jgi:hypothetical protein
MATTGSITLQKTIPFKGGNRIYSNRYHFNGTLPPDSTHWDTLRDNIVNAEKACHYSNVHITRALGYAAGSDVPVYDSTISVAGTLTPVSGALIQAGEVAALVRYSTPNRSTKNHPIYCFNYYHFVFVSSTSGNGDLLDANQKDALETLAGDWVSGIADGTVDHVRTSPAGHVCNGYTVAEWVTHRDFPYTRSA